jgi:hypothetical protein
MKQTHSVHLHLQHDQAVKLSLAGGKLLQIEHSHHWAAQPQGLKIGIVPVLKIEKNCSIKQ